MKFPRVFFHCVYDLSLISNFSENCGEENTTYLSEFSYSIQTKHKQHRKMISEPRALLGMRDSTIERFCRAAVLFHCLCSSLSGKAK